MVAPGSGMGPRSRGLPRPEAGRAGEGGPGRGRPGNWARVSAPPRPGLREERCACPRDGLLC